MHNFIEEQNSKFKNYSKITSIVQFFCFVITMQKTKKKTRINSKNMYEKRKTINHQQNNHFVSIARLLLSASPLYSLPFYNDNKTKLFDNN